jgi:hypothetical protein
VLEDEDYNSNWLNIWLIRFFFFFLVLYFLAVCLVAEKLGQSGEKEGNEKLLYYVVYFSLDFGNESSVQLME